jgi:hypothetical protein
VNSSAKFHGHIVEVADRSRPMPNFCGCHRRLSTQDAIDEVAMVSGASPQTHLKIIRNWVIDADVATRTDFPRENVRV